MSTRTGDGRDRTPYVSIAHGAHHGPGEIGMGRRILAIGAVAAMLVPVQASASTAMAAALQTYFARERLIPLRQASAPDEGVMPSWDAGEWTEWSSTCSDSATRTRSVQCKAGGVVLPDARCTGTMPEHSEVDGVYSSCENAWEAYSVSTGSGQACESGGVKTITVNYQCQRTSDGTAVANSECTGLARPSWRNQVACESLGVRHREWNGSSWGPRFTPVVFDGLLTVAQVEAKGIEYCNQQAAEGYTGDCYMTYWYHYGSVGKTGIDVGKSGAPRGSTVHQYPVTNQGLRQNSSRGAPQYRYSMDSVPAPAKAIATACSKYSIGSPSYWIIC